MIRADRIKPYLLPEYARRAVRIVGDLVDDVELDRTPSGRFTITGLLGNGESVALASEWSLEAALAHLKARKHSGSLVEIVEARERVVAMKNNLRSMLD